MMAIGFGEFGLATAAAVALFIFAVMQTRLRSQSRLIEAAKRDFEATFEQAVVGVAHLDTDGRWIRINQRFCEIAGRSHDELLKITVDDITHPEDRARDHADRDAMIQAGLDQSAIEKRYVRGDGSIVWVSATRSAIRGADGKPVFFVAVVEEITARKEAEIRLSTGEARYRAIFDSAVEAMAVIDAAGTIQSVNPALESTFGYTQEDLLGKNIKMLMPREIASHHDGYLRRYRETGVKEIIGKGREVIGRRKDGTVFPLDLSVAEWQRSGETFFTGVIRDVSARKDAERALVSGEAQYRAIFDSAVEAMAVIDAKGNIQSVNPALVETFGYAPIELLGKNIKMLMPRAIARQHDGYLGRYHDTGVKAIIGIGREVIGQRKDGTVFPLDLSVAEWQREGVTFFTGVMRDVSARKDAETALRASEDQLLLLQNEFAHLARVNDLGEMAAAIAHEINQPLTAIVNYLDTGVAIAADGYSEGGFAEVAELIQYASDQALRAGDIVRRLREFIGHDNAMRIVENADQLVDAAMALALIDARTSGIIVERRKDSPGAMVEVDAIQIQQVLVNLMRNAVDALRMGPSDGGLRLVVSTAIRPDGAVEFAVEDNGPGIPPELAERVFEPFVTTKSNGMGMGLSVCRRLIESHGGAIEAENRPGAGATFRFHLPHFRASAH
jgi:two-component system sensor kinase FixL